MASLKEHYFDLFRDFRRLPARSLTAVMFNSFAFKLLALAKSENLVSITSRNLNHVQTNYIDPQSYSPIQQLMDFAVTKWSQKNQFGVFGKHHPAGLIGSMN